MPPSGGTVPLITFVFFSDFPPLPVMVDNIVLGFGGYESQQSLR